MSAINVSGLDIGPVIGHTTEDSIKIWGRANKSSKQGIVELRNEGSDDSIVEVFSFDDALDNTGVLQLTNLKARLNMSNEDRMLQYRVGRIDLGLDVENGSDLNWNGITLISVKLAPSQSKTDFNFIFGSCRHLDMLLDQQKDERCFKVIDQQKYEDGSKQADFMMFTGDQVYADHPLSWIYKPYIKRQLKKESHYQKHYHKSWRRKYFSRVTSKHPSYMMWDDHEVINDWNADDIASKERKGVAYEHGEKYFRAYQSSLNPNNYEQEFYYSFSYGRGDFFVMDVRSDKSIIRNQLLGDKQKQAFKDWLLEPSDKIKFIISPVPVAPDARRFLATLWNPLNIIISGGSKDRWDVFPNEREWLFDLIEQYQNLENSRPVIILSGDVHCSYGAQVKYQTNTDSSLNVYQLVSSGFYWPIVGLNRQHFDFKSPLKVAGRFKSKLISKFIGGKDKVITSHNFCFISVTQNTVKAEWYSEHGNKLHMVNIKI